jgi:capsule polysaccharide modification protein KpsS
LHPAEIASGGTNGVGELISTNFPELPENIEVITHNDSNTLDLLKQSSGVITCYGTSGLEAATFGIPTILAGEAYYGQKGFTFDPQTIQEYESLLLNISRISKLDNAQVELAKKFAYLIWIEHQYILDWLDDSNITKRIRTKSLMIYDKNAVRIFRKNSVAAKIITEHLTQD